MIGEIPLLSLLKNNLQFVAVAMICFIAAYFSEGFFHPDEHFSTIELMHLKINPQLDQGLFGWDVDLKIRSYFQPFLYYILLAPLRVLEFNDPFIQVFLLRLFQALLFIFSFNYFLKNFLKDSDDRFRLNLLLLTCATWFIPFVIVRTSSESLSSSLFLLALGFALKENKETLLRWSFMAGLLAGLSFLARFQMGIPAFFLCLWLMFVAKKKYLELISYCVGIGVTFAILLLVDFWGYGEWLSSPWNYLSENIFKSRASEFGTDPWYFYFKTILIKGAFPISFPLLAATLYYFYKFHKSVLTWILVPFILVHIVIAHKEWRFLTFVYILAPLMSFSVLEQIIRKNIQKPSWKIALSFIVFLNSALLLKVCLTKAHSPIGIYKILYREVDSSLPLLTLKKEQKPPLDLMLRFYSKHERFVNAVSIDELNMKSVPFYLLTSTYEEMNEMQSRVPNCHWQDGIYPNWLLNFNFFKWRDRSSIWNLYHCR